MWYRYFSFDPDTFYPTTTAGKEDYHRSYTRDIQKVTVVYA